MTELAILRMRIGFRAKPRPRGRVIGEGFAKKESGTLRGAKVRSIGRQRACIVEGAMWNRIWVQHYKDASDVTMDPTLQTKTPVDLVAG